MKRTARRRKGRSERLHASDRSGLPDHPSSASGGPWPCYAGRWTWLDGVLAAVFAFFAFRTFGWMVVESGDALRIQSAHNLGDLTLHVQLIQAIARGWPWWSQSTILSGIPLGYPVGTDLLNAGLLKLGVPWEIGLVWVGLIASAVTWWALRRWGGAFVIAGFLFNGGFFAWALMEEGVLRDFQSTVAWKSIPLTIFATQRGMLVALPVGLWLLVCWRAWLERALTGKSVEGQGHRGQDSRHALVGGGGTLAALALLPLFHVHTWLFLMGLLGYWMVWGGGRVRGSAAITFGLSAVVSLPCLTVATGWFMRRTGLAWKPGWMCEVGENPLAFWLMNFGILLPLAVLLLWQLLRRTGREAQVARLFVIPATVCFVACGLVRFTTWEWDNTKFIIWSYLVVLPFLASELLDAWPRLLRWLTVAVLYASGAISLFGGLGTDTEGFAWIKRAELARTELLLSRLPEYDRVATSSGPDDFSHPVMICGWPVAVGYEGHLFSYGLDYEPSRSLLKDILAGRRGWSEAAESLGVRYVFRGPRERERYGSGPRPWESAWPLEAALPGYEIRGVPPD